MTSIGHFLKKSLGIFVQLGFWKLSNFLFQEELAAAAEKLAECQETIFLLGKQLKALRPQTDTSPPSNGRSQNVKASVEEEPAISGMLQDFICTKQAQSVFNASFSPSDSEVNNLLRSPTSSKYPKHRPTKSGSSSVSSTPTLDKHGRGFSRFFSSKAKNAS